MLETAAANERAEWEKAEQEAWREAQLRIKLKGAGGEAGRVGGARSCGRRGAHEGAVRPSRSAVSRPPPACA